MLELYDVSYDAPPHNEAHLRWCFLTVTISATVVWITPIFLERHVSYDFGQTEQLLAVLTH